MAEYTPPPRRVIAGFVLVAGAVAWFLMYRTYRNPRANACHTLYAAATTLAETLAVERQVPGAESGEAGGKSCGWMRSNARWFEIPGTAEALVGQAIAAAGGADALDSLTALEWDGSATVHLPDTSLQILGRWQLIPPDTARVTTWLADQDSTSARTMIVAAPRGWIVRDGGALPMPPEMLIEERHQSYLYSLLRLVPLRDPEVTLSLLPNDAQGRRGFLVRRPGRLDVEMYLSADDRVERMMTRFAVPGDGIGPTHEIRLEGWTALGPVRWFRRMHIIRDGAPYFDLIVTQGRPAPAPERIGIPQ